MPYQLSIVITNAAMVAPAGIVGSTISLIIDAECVRCSFCSAEVQYDVGNQQRLFWVWCLQLAMLEILPKSIFNHLHQLISLQYVCIMEGNTEVQSILSPPFVPTTAAPPRAAPDSSKPSDPSTSHDDADSESCSQCSFSKH